MLTRIFSLRNVGLFESGAPFPVDLGRATLIYAENGRGKSTLASVLRACAEGDKHAVSARKTLDSTGEPEIGMLFSVGRIAFENGAWTASAPGVVLFDGPFIEKNVYTGFEVRAEQRQSLLDFALGATAVGLKEEVDLLTEKIKVATASRSVLEGKLAIFRKTMSLAEFKALPEPVEADNTIAALRERIENSKKQQAIQKRPELSPLFTIDQNLSGIYEVLGSALGGIEESAERAVRAHLGAHNSPGFEGWLSKGQTYTTDDSCPFCGQGLEGINLVRAYQSYFNQEYRALKEKVANLKPAIEAKYSSAKIDEMARLVETNRERVQAWSDQVPLQAPEVDVEAIGVLVAEVKLRLVLLSDQKIESPLDPVRSSEDAEELEGLIAQANQRIMGYNSAVELANETIGAFKRQLIGTDQKSLEAEISKLEAQKTRFSSDVQSLFRELDSVEGERADYDRQKTKARSRLDAQMTQTMEEYRVEINRWLEKFGASFSIEQMRPNYQGGGLPRTEYGLKVRGTPVRLTPKAEGDPSFGTTLSEGDKRTLALAFFLSRLLQRADLSELTIVIDDPVTSLDLGRRHQTKVAIRDLASRCKQVIVLAHDPHFLRALHKALKTAIGEVKVLRVTRVEKDYSILDTTCDLEEICASPYLQHYRAVREFVDGGRRRSVREVSKLLRPLVEAHLRRRFPNEVREGVPLGDVIAAIYAAKDPSPLVVMKKDVVALSDLNDYASRYHHDNPNAEAEQISDQELQTYCQQGLKLIHSGGLS